jgi:hypothetical protein
MDKKIGIVREKDELNIGDNVYFISFINGKCSVKKSRITELSKPYFDNLKYSSFVYWDKQSCQIFFEALYFDFEYSKKIKELNSKYGWEINWYDRRQEKYRFSIENDEVLLVNSNRNPFPVQPGDWYFSIKIEQELRDFFGDRLKLIHSKYMPCKNYSTY